MYIIRNQRAGEEKEKRGRRENYFELKDDLNFQFKQHAMIGKVRLEIVQNIQHTTTHLINY